MLLEQLKSEKGFTNHEKDVARFILENLERIPQMSAGEVAKGAFTSKATVVRLGQKLGLSGYQEFRIKLVAEVSQKNRIDKILANRSIIRRAQYLREATNNYIVGIAGPHNEEMKKCCHEVVEIPNRDSLLSLDVVSSFSGVNYVIDIFFSLLLAERYDEHTKSSLDMMNHVDLLWDGAYEKIREEE